jgi:hypothetical protein
MSSEGRLLVGEREQQPLGLDRRQLGALLHVGATSIPFTGSNVASRD